MKTYTVSMTFTVVAETSAPIRTQQAINRRVQRWMESLNAEIEDAVVRDVQVVKSARKARAK